MSSAAKIKELALQLPQRSRLKLAGELLRSATPGISATELLAEAVERDAEIENGTVLALGEEEFWEGVRRSRSRR